MCLFISPPTNALLIFFVCVLGFRYYLNGGDAFRLKLWIPEAATAEATGGDGDDGNEEGDGAGTEEEEEEGGDAGPSGENESTSGEPASI